MENKLRDRRLQRRMSLQEVSDQTGITVSTLQRYESGKIKNIKWQNLEKLSRVYLCEPADLLGWANEGDAPPIKAVPILGTDRLFSVDATIDCDYVLIVGKNDAPSGRYEGFRMVFIRKTKTVISGDIYAFKYDGIYRSQKLFFMDGTVIIGGEPPIITVKDEIEIIGRVTGVYEQL